GDSTARAAAAANRPRPLIPRPGGCFFRPRRANPVFPTGDRLMEMTGEYVIPAPRTQVWAALNDINVLKDAIPGCEVIAQVAPDQIEATVTAKVGPVKASFKGLVTLSDLDPPNGYTIRGEGKGGAAGFARGGAKVRLSDAPGGTRLSYTVDAAVGGKLAQIGSRLIDSTAKKLADEFFAAFSAKVTGKPAVASAPVAEE